MIFFVITSIDELLMSAKKCIFLKEVNSHFHSHCHMTIDLLRVLQLSNNMSYLLRNYLIAVSCYAWFLKYFCFISVMDNNWTIDLFSDEESHMDVHDRALLYYRLLKTNVKEVMTD